MKRWIVAAIMACSISSHAQQLKVEVVVEWMSKDVLGRKADAESMCKSALRALGDVVVVPKDAASDSDIAVLISDDWRLLNWVAVAIRYPGGQLTCCLWTWAEFEDQIKSVAREFDRDFLDKIRKDRIK